MVVKKGSLDSTGVPTLVGLDHAPLKWARRVRGFTQNHGICQPGAIPVLFPARFVRERRSFSEVRHVNGSQSQER
jgi:hypothetical protein